MAKGKRRAQARDRRRGIRRFNALFVVCCFLVLIAAALPTVIVIGVGMIPTIVALIIDVTPGRYAARCVAGMNAAGVVPFLDKLWSSTNDMSAAISVITDVYAWFAFYAASGIGWLLFLGLPSLVASYKTFSARRSANALRERQDFLVKEWGPEVAGNAAVGRHDHISGNPEPGDAQTTRGAASNARGAAA